MQKVSFNYADRTLSLNDKIKIRSFIESEVFITENIQLRRLNYIFCSDEYLLDINKKFLKHDYLTDIITFDLSEQNGVTGEVYISLDRVRDNAKTFDSTFSDECLRVIIHGALHLCGYKDKNKIDKKEMRKKENFYLNIYKKSST